MQLPGLSFSLSWRLMWWSVFCLSLWLARFPATACAVDFPTVSGTAACRHEGLPSSEAASSQARVVAWLKALRTAEAHLPLPPAFSAAAPRLTGLTASLYSISSFTSCTDGQKSVEVHLTTLAGIQDTLAHSLRNPELPALYERLIAECKALLHHLQGLMNHGRTNDSPVTKAMLCRQLDGLWMALSNILPEPEGWLCSITALSPLTEAALMAPASPAVRLLLAEAQLRQNLPLECVESCDAALRMAPALGRAFYVRALAHWRLHQLALAERDLDAALQSTLEPPPQGQELVRRLRARGAVRMLRGYHDGMCDDFMAACSLGDCEGLAAARQQGYCRSTSNLEQP